MYGHGHHGHGRKYTNTQEACIEEIPLLDLSALEAMAPSAQE